MDMVETASSNASTEDMLLFDEAPTRHKQLDGFYPSHDTVRHLLLCLPCDAHLSGSCMRLSTWHSQSSRAGPHFASSSSARQTGRCAFQTWLKSCIQDNCCKPRQEIPQQATCESARQAVAEIGIMPVPPLWPPGQCLCPDAVLRTHVHDSGVANRRGLSCRRRPTCQPCRRSRRRPRSASPHCPPAAPATTCPPSTSAATAPWTGKPASCGEWPRLLSLPSSVAL